MSKSKVLHVRVTPETHARVGRLVLKLNKLTRRDINNSDWCRDAIEAALTVGEAEARKLSVAGR